MMVCESEVIIQLSLLAPYSHKTTKRPEVLTWTASKIAYLQSPDIDVCPINLHIIQYFKPPSTELIPEHHEASRPHIGW